MMVINSASLTQWDAQRATSRGYKFYANCYYVEIKDSETGEIVFKRGKVHGDVKLNNDWLDDKHRRITDALSALENALLAVLPNSVD